MTPADKARQNYDRHPYPGPVLGKIIGRGSTLPPLKWIQAIGRPGRPNPKRVLVAGCGTGTEAFVMRRRLPNAEIVAVDFSPKSIAAARREQRSSKPARPVLFQVADLTDHDLAATTGGNFDLITCHGVLTYIPEPGRVLRNFASCLRPGGALYLGVNGESHASARLRPWLAGFGLDVGAMGNERRLRELLVLRDSLHEDGPRKLAEMSASYLASDVCGPHFSNWPMARWRAEASQAGWEVAGHWLLPHALRLLLTDENYRHLFPSSMGELIERVDQIRPSGFHRMLLRKAAPVGSGGEDGLHWTGLYSVRFRKLSRSGMVTAVLSCPVFNLRLDWPLTARQAESLRVLADSGTTPSGWMSRWGRSEAARRILWLWTGFGIVASDNPGPDPNGPSL